MMEWLSALQRLRREGRAGVLVTVLSSRGHVPRGPGAKMVVAEHAAYDSIGGGNLEATAIDHARRMLSASESVPETAEMPLNERVRTEHGTQCCGGVVTLLYEPIPAPAVVAIFGMGHVGRELARVLCRQDLQLHLADSREGFAVPGALNGALEGPAEVAWHHAPVPEALLRQLPEGAHVLIMTHDHAEDLFLCEAALGREDLGTIGVIGSSAKWSRFRRRLSESGHTEESMSRIHCPIGLPEISGKAPAVIALSVAAALARHFPQASR